MSFSSSSAITYNNGKNYSSKAIGIMQSLVTAPGTQKWDTTSVTKVYGWQGGKPEAGTADGMVGAKTLGVMIRDLDKASRTSDAIELKKYPYEPCVATSPVIRFMSPQGMGQPTWLQETQTGSGASQTWKVFTTFAVEVDLSSVLTAQQTKLIEYRQFIKGQVKVRGWENDTALPWIIVDQGVDDAEKAFQIPTFAGYPASTTLPSTPVTTRGLDKTRWKEDGILRGWEPCPYGYRDASYPGNEKERDIWLGDRLTSRTYRLKDSPSIGGVFGPKANWMEIVVDLNFRGCVVEVDVWGEPVKVLAERYWNIAQPEGQFWVKKH